MRLSAQEPVQEAAEPRLFRQAAEGDRRARQPRLIRQQRRGTEINPSAQRMLIRHTICLALLLAGCKHVSELQVQQHQEAASAATTETHEVKESGPEHIVMTVEEYEQLCPGKETPGASTPRATHEAGTPGVSGSILTRRTVTVTDRGPSLDDLRQFSSLQSKVNTALAVHEEKKSGPAGILGLLGASWPLILIGGAVLAGVVAFKLKPGLFGVALGAMKGLLK